MIQHAAPGNGPTRTPLIFAVVFLGIGLVLFIAAIITNLAVSSARSDLSAKTTGQVVSVRMQQSSSTGTYSSRRHRSHGSSHSSSSGPTYCPTIAYTVDGKRYQYDSSTCTNPAPTVGEQMALRYNPDNPADASTDSWVARWLAVVILGGLGLIFASIGAVFLFVHRRSGVNTAPAYGGNGPISFP